MKSVLPIGLALALVALISWQLVLLFAPTAGPAGGLERVPVFSPASLGVSASGGTSCPGAMAPDAAGQRLLQAPLEQVLDTMARSGGAQHSPEVQAALAAIADQHRALLDLRNARHAWNTESMELTTQLADVLEHDQLDWVLSNRDRITREKLDQGTWQRLGVQP